MASGFLPNSKNIQIPRVRKDQLKNKGVRTDLNPSSARRGDGKELVTTLQSLSYLHHTQPFQCQMASFRKGPIGIGRHQADSSHLLTGSDIGIQLSRAR